MSTPDQQRMIARNTTLGHYSPELAVDPQGKSSGKDRCTVKSQHPLKQ